MTAPSWCPFLSAGTVQSSPALPASGPAGTAASQCCGAALFETSIQSTGEESSSHVRHQWSRAQTRKICIYFWKFKFEAFTRLYLVAAHVVTCVHDDGLPPLVVLSDVQAGFGAEIFQLKADITEYKENIYSVTNPQRLNRGKWTHSAKLFRVQIRKVDFWVDGVQVPGEVLAVQPLSQLQAIGYVPILVLQRATQLSFEMNKYIQKAEEFQKHNHSPKCGQHRLTPTSLAMAAALLLRR